MTANKMPEMPEAPAGLKGWLSSHQQDLLREYVEMHGRSCYLAGIAAARECVPTQGANVYGYSFNDCRETTLANLDALEQEFAP